MLSIPIHIIGTRRLGLFTPLLLYVLGILVFCQLFVALFGRQQSGFKNLKPTDQSSDLDQSQSQGSRVFRRSVGSVSVIWQNGSTGRSDSTQIWAGHQNSDGRFIGNVLDLDREEFFPWSRDSECRNFSVHFAKRLTFKPRALVSFPGSGNSWFRYLIDSSTGIFTGSIFNDRELFEAGLLGEMTWPNDGSTIVQKTHHDAFSNMDLNRIEPSLSNKRKLQAFIKVSELVFGYRGILLIRNPYEALLSYWNFMKTKEHTGHAQPSDFSTLQWRKFVILGSQKWARLIKSWLQNSMDLHIVLYENLREEPEEELMRLLNYLNLQIDNQRLHCVMKHLEGPFHRHSDDITTNSTTLDQNTPRLSSPLDLIIQQHIDDVNNLFSRKELPVRLNYTLPEKISSFYT